jgi:hypothetical protein
MFNQLCVWPGVIVGSTPQEQEELVKFMKNEMGVRVKYHTEVQTLPDLNPSGKAIPETGGRNDLFFFVHDEDVSKFAVPRLHLGIRWWEDVIVYNDNSNLYTPEFIQANPPKW